MNTAVLFQNDVQQSQIHSLSNNYDYTRPMQMMAEIPDLSLAPAPVRHLQVDGRSPYEAPYQTNAQGEIPLDNIYLTPMDSQNRYIAPQVKSLEIHSAGAQEGVEHMLPTVGDWDEQMLKAGDNKGVDPLPRAPFNGQKYKGFGPVKGVPVYGSGPVLQPVYGAGPVMQPKYGSGPVEQPRYGSGPVTQPIYGPGPVMQPRYGSGPVTQRKYAPMPPHSIVSKAPLKSVKVPINPHSFEPLQPANNKKPIHGTGPQKIPTRKHMKTALIFVGAAAGVIFFYTRT